MKKLHMLIKDESLVRRLQSISEFNEYSNSDKVNEIQDVDTDVLVIDDELVEINQLLEIRGNIECKYVFFLVSEKNFRFSTKNILQNNNIHLILKNKTNEQIVEHILLKVISNYKNTLNKNSITFFGADTKVGVTQLSQCVAENIANKIVGKVGLLFLNGKPSTEYFSYKFKNNIDDIKVKLVSGIITESEVLSISEKIKDNLFVIQGVKSLLYRNEYHPHHLEQLLNIYSNVCDVIIIDSGTHLDRGLTLAALYSTNNKYLVATQQKTSYLNYNRKRELLSSFGLDDFQLIVNKFQRDGALPNEYEVARDYSQPFAFKVDYSTYGWQSEQDEKTLLNYNEKNFVKDIDRISSSIIKQLNLTIKDKENINTNKRRFFRRR
jgi:MinD-like ATPase involved in chromosome partitioning or flagellar assembly